MASLQPQIATAAYFSSFFTNPSTLLCHPSFIAANNYTQRGLKASCKATDNGDNHQQQDIPKNAPTSRGKFDRREVLLGLGGLYGATTLDGASELAQAKPVAVDFVDCVLAIKPDEQRINCCPPGKVPPADIKDYQVPAVQESQIRIRPAAHLVDDEYLSKYTQAIQQMKKLPADDPRNFHQQANIHCAFCDAAYTQVGYPNEQFQVHSSWIFFPWHRWYLYFFERICQEMIQDPTFSLPFWNWDAPHGMKIPPIFDNPNLVLWDVNRNPNHRGTAVVDLLFNGQDSGLSPEQQIATNLTTMYRQMISLAKRPRQFFGAAYRAGSDANPGAGTIETAPHNTVHPWTGDVPGGTRNPLGEDMGVFYSAGRDPIFYSHHSNVDRMWPIWLGLGGTQRNLRCRDWLKASFVFYDEKAQPVRVTVEQALDTKTLGYVYQCLPLPWLDAKPTPRRTKAVLPTAPKPGEVFPTVLDKVINVLVPRPKKSRSKKDKDAEEEILVIDGIEYNLKDRLRFDVFINEDDVTACTPANTEFVGAFAHVPHSHGMKVKSCLRLGITEVVDELGADDSDKLLVTLVPRTGTVTIGNAFIEFDSDPDEF